MHDKYLLEKIDPDDEWNEFVRNSVNGTIFSYSDYLNALDTRKAFYFCYNKNELRAAIAVIENDAGDAAVFHDFVIYNGLMFAPPTTGQNYAQRLSERFRIAEFVANELTRIYCRVELALSPSFVDIRPFLWVNYGSEKPKYHVNVRYTSYLDIKDFAKAKKTEDIEAYNRASKARRQEIRYARRKNVVTSEEFVPEVFVDMYTATMERQNFAVADKKRKEMHTLMSSIQSQGLGRMFVARTAEGKIGSLAFFVLDHQRAYYLFGANDSLLRDQHTGTAVLWDAFAFLNVSGVAEVDLEGVNSPYRGWFKLSFGGDLLPYYELVYARGQ